MVGSVELDPHTVVWEYTLRCNSRCIHCGSDASSPRRDELTSEEALDLVDQMADVGFRRVFLSGGEPTLRKDWFQTAQRIQERGMELGLLSNALAWTDETIDQVASLNMYGVGFSVDGERETHDFCRGAPGSHDKIFDAVRKLKRLDQVICIITAINKRNLPELVQLRNRMIIYEIDAWQLQMASPMGRMAEHMDLVLSEEEYYRLGEFVVETREQLVNMNIGAADCMGYYGKLEKGLRDSGWPGCGAGIWGIGIESDGGVKGCLSIRTARAVEANIRDQSLREIWKNPENFKYNRNFELSDLKGECAHCEKGERCKGGCSSQSIAFYDEFHRAPYCFLRFEKRQSS